MIAKLISALQETQGVTPHPAAEPSTIGKFSISYGLTLPLQHLEVLSWSNGVEAYAGYVRLFGVNTEEAIDSVLWNDYDYWKFAWDQRCSDFWCFGETAWGDQYAYSIDSLKRERDSPVYLLDAVSMTPQVLCASFLEFFEGEFIRVARAPYDDMIRFARDKFGPLDPKQHLVYIPSLLLGGQESIDHVQTMEARVAMICNGDLAIQLDNGPADGSVKSVSTLQDREGRMRLHLEWE